MADAPDYGLHGWTTWLMLWNRQKLTSTMQRRRYWQTPSGFDPSRLTYLRRNLLSFRKSLFYEREILIKISAATTANGFLKSNSTLP